MWKLLFLFTVIIWMVSPAYSAVLECNWDSSANCMPYNITPVTQPNEVITINGQSSDYVNLKTEYISLSNQVFNYIPTGFFTLFPNLKVLYFGNYETTTLSTDSIPSCGQLEQLIINGGQFTNIPAGFVESCKSLQYMGIIQNSVETIDLDAFRGLTNLTYLIFVYGKLTCLPNGLFQHNPALIQVQFYGNRITAVDSNAFANLPLLQGIGLGMNLLSFIPNLNLSTAASNDTLFYLDFSSNPIYAISPDLCSNLAQVGSFSCSIYNISCLTNNAQAAAITNLNCQDIANLQNCYSNWTSAMTEPSTCGIKPTTTTTSTTTTTTTTTTTSTTTTLAPTTLPPVRPGPRPHHIRKCHPIKKVD